jgi:hypothetical protein
MRHVRGTLRHRARRLASEQQLRRCDVAFDRDFAVVIMFPLPGGVR